MRHASAACAVALLALLFGCGDDATTTGTPTPTPTSTPSASASPTPVQATSPSRGTVVKAASSDFGQILFDGKGQAIYLFDKEKTSKPECYGACAEAWPPVLSTGAPVAVAGARAALLGTVKRTDGSSQVTYKGHPLYFYAHEGPDEVRCHNVPGFGGLWLAVAPSGDAAPT